MDLGAYKNIENISEIAEQNGIDVPRLRGYRLMKDEQPIDYRDVTRELDVDCVHDLATAMPFWNPHPCAYEFSRRTNKKVLKYLTGDPFDGESEEPVRVRWENINGKKKKILKTMIHNRANRYKKQYDVWNKYAGCEDILYIHARIGGPNWPDYMLEVIDKPWFIEKVDDAFDNTYCDIYARIK